MKTILKASGCPRMLMIGYNYAYAHKDLGCNVQ